MPENTTNTNLTPSQADGEGSFLGRRDLWGMVIGGIAILLVYLVLTGRDASQSEGSAQSAESSRPRAMLVVASVEVQPTKADGRRWDTGANGLPDPCVTVINRTSGGRRRTHKVDDTLTAVFNTRMFTVRDGDDLYVRVDDIDVQFDDLVGEHRFQVTRQMIDKGEVDLTFGQVKRLTLRFEKPK